MSNREQVELINSIPKAELHVHIEGTFEPELMFTIAERNDIRLKYKSVDDLRAAYQFNNLQEFLDLYYAGAYVLLYEQDFYDLTMAYLKKCHEEKVVHTEIFFDPQTHTQRGVPFKNVINGILQACIDARNEWGITYRLIPNFLRHLSEEDAIKTFKESLQYGELFTAYGLDSSEKGHPPAKFKKVFEMVRTEGFLTVAHAGEEGPAQNVWDAIELLKVARIDHGVRSIDDAELLDKLARIEMPLTVCPLSNLKLKVVNDMADHPLKKLLDHNIVATINSDDPAYFGGYMNANFQSVTEALDLTNDDIVTLAVNSFKASFLSDEEKQKWFRELALQPLL
ncbi:adenosine deaminase [Draconibacterium orientale]|jgi:adenosine deaminase|uniref:Adenine deaminase n=1 Tax=Draconibacterium orientale TaxID=1168034 RepID=X5DEV1_9BACT|nr:adenosine deaminase [Draconibacterium orientale]AHW59564.1 adenine deaminase [Draconibacterium orientale]SEU11706.1 adenosine deaminase [Draconibacterium orientale]